MAHRRTMRWIKKRRQKEKRLPACYQAKQPSEIIQSFAPINSAGVYTQES